MLTDEERTTLLSIARQSIEAALDGRVLDDSAFTLTAALRRVAGTFVTLSKQRELRGCIGTIEPVEPLYRSVVRNAVNAAFGDPRFPPLSRSEWPVVAVQVSVMGPIERVADTSEIVPGRDGLIVRRGGRAGLLLPQVASEWGWDRETFLGQTCLKAGLPASCWREPGTVLEKFSAEVFP